MSDSSCYKAIVIDLGNHDTVLLSGPKLTWPSYRVSILPLATQWGRKYEPGLFFGKPLSNSILGRKTGRKERIQNSVGLVGHFITCLVILWIF